MIGSFLSRGLLLILGYVYPAYECYKSVEMNKPDIEQLRFWCQYWILVTGLTVCERIADMFIGWVPMYGEAKLAFFIYLWFPKTKGTTYVYDSFFRPYVAKHETEIDRNLLELRTRAGDMALLYWQKAASYGQTRIFDVLQYIASQSPPPQRAQPFRHGTRVQKPAAPLNQGPGATTQLQDEQPSSPALSDHQEDATDKAGPSGDSKPAPTPAPPPAVPKEQKTVPMQALIETVKISEELEMMQVD
ncbi:putative HVA22-like protein g [Primulina tabacum]|uniref:putative HVA22-like protein g n=1 Tax=Primulina tabacum TaxID=48773 RepID=UPI003F5A70C8